MLTVFNFCFQKLSKPKNCDPAVLNESFSIVPIFFHDMFEWKIVMNRQALGDVCYQKFGWDAQKIQETLEPIQRRLSEAVAIHILPPNTLLLRLKAA